MMEQAVDDRARIVLGLQCNNCNILLSEQPRYNCPEAACAAPGLEVVYDYARIKQSVTRGERWLLDTPSMWRYANLLPCRESPRVGLSTGGTPLVEANNLARTIGLEKLYIKDDSTNRPTLSYKDRVVATAINKAIEFGFEAIGCVSTGNVANSVSALAAAARLPAFVVVPENTEQGKIIGSLIYGAQVVRVRGNYDDANQLCRELVKTNDKIGVVNINLRSYYSEGAKTVTYEIAEKLGWRLPKHIILPLAGATLLLKTAKAVKELQDLGLIDLSPVKIYGAQAAGSSPIANAFEAGRDNIIPVVPDTIASSLAIGNPGDGRAALLAVRDSGGRIGAVSDEEIKEGIELLARTEGIFAEAAGGTTMAVTRKLVISGLIPRNEEVVMVITGNGFKTPDPILGRLNLLKEINNDLNELRRVVNL
ncbi:MAG: threonine synthase [Candidatus Daviesbacteria bacterium]|nr:threonine synthase [Candidatus Daviesbacteria bacterium]